MKNTLNDLNNYLFEAIERLNDDDLSEEQLDKEIKRSEAVQKVAKTIIENGQLALQAKNKDGYIEVKVEEPNKWKLKHRVVWESVNGKIPKGYVVIFRDNDKTNTNIENLILVDRGTLATLNKTGLCNYNGEFKETAINIAKLKSSQNKAKRRNRK